jgi:hypothetical protein
MSCFEETVGEYTQEFVKVIVLPDLFWLKYIKITTSELMPGFYVHFPKHKPIAHYR